MTVDSVVVAVILPPLGNSGLIMVLLRRDVGPTLSPAVITTYLDRLTLALLMSILILLVLTNALLPGLVLPGTAICTKESLPTLLEEKLIS